MQVTQYVVVGDQVDLDIGKSSAFEKSSIPLWRSHSDMLGKLLEDEIPVLHPFEKELSVRACEGTRVRRA